MAYRDDFGEESYERRGGSNHQLYVPSYRLSYNSLQGGIRKAKDSDDEI